MHRWEEYCSEISTSRSFVLHQRLRGSKCARKPAWEMDRTRIASCWRCFSCLCGIICFRAIQGWLSNLTFTFIANPFRYPEILMLCQVWKRRDENFLPPRMCVWDAHYSSTDIRISETWWWERGTTRQSGFDTSAGPRNTGESRLVFLNKKWDGLIVDTKRAIGHEHK